MTEPHTPTQAELADLRDVLADETDRDRRHSAKTGPSAENGAGPLSVDPRPLEGPQIATDRFGWRRHPRIQEQP